MAIPKQIFQTFKTKNLPWLTKYHVWKMRKMNPEYSYNFFDDTMILDFLENEYPVEYLKAYKKLTIGAAKADFFRYAILYKRGGVYLDIDSGVKKSFDKFVLDSDQAIISCEKNPGYYVQWALFFNKEHPFLKRTLELVLDNIETHRFPHDVHSTTGPAAYSMAVNQCISEAPNIPHRFMATDYDNNLLFKYKLGKILLYRDKSEHWKRKQKNQPIIIES